MSSLPAPTPWTGDLPLADVPDGVHAVRIETGSYATRAAMAVQGGSFRDRRDFAANAVLVSHPRGDLLIDAGFGSRVREHVRHLNRLERAPLTVGRTVREQLDHAGYDWSRLLGVLPTHVHWDHVSGIEDLDTTIWINAAEIEHAAQAADGAVFREVSAGHDVRRYVFDGPSHLGFPASHDVHGDGSVVVALAGGHTQGSVVVFVTCSDGSRHALLGDLTWQVDGLAQRRERPWLIRRLADSDPSLVRENLLRAIALDGRMNLVPAHDLRAHDVLEPLPADLRSCARA